MDKKPLIIITEDDFENQRFLEIFLRKNFDIKISDSDTSFYSLLEENIPNIIIMDISLKGKKNGLEIIKELKNDKKYSQIPILCLSAHAFQADMDNALNSGADAFLSKPVENEVLINTLTQLLSKEQTVQE